MFFLNLYTTYRTLGCGNCEKVTVLMKNQWCVHIKRLTDVEEVAAVPFSLGGIGQEYDAARNTKRPRLG